MFETDFDKLRFTNDYIFCHVLMENIELCKKITELATGRKIYSIGKPMEQISIKETIDGKGVRFDVIFEDDTNTIYDVEMQKANQYNLPMRTRYYQSIIDLDSLKSGKDYKAIKNGYIIFICNFDPFGMGDYRYVAKTHLVNYPEYNFNDKIEKIFLNSDYKKDRGFIDREVSDFLDYIKLNIIKSKLTKEIDDATKRILNSAERRAEYMTLMEKVNIAREKGFAEAIIKLIEKGYTKEEISQLLDISEKEIEEAQKIISFEIL